MWYIVVEIQKVPELKQKEKSLRRISETNIPYIKLALSTIYLNIDPDFRKITENNDNLIEACKKLQTHFYPDTWSRHMQVFTKLCECKIANDKSINLYAARLLWIAKQLKSINKEFDAVYETFQHLRFLSSKFDGIVHAILRCTETDFIFNDIVTALAVEETRLSLRQQNHNKAYTEAQSIQLKKINLFYCSKPGHFKNKCQVSYGVYHRNLDSSPSAEFSLS